MAVRLKFRSPVPVKEKRRQTKIDFQIQTENRRRSKRWTTTASVAIALFTRKADPDFQVSALEDLDSCVKYSPTEIYADYRCWNFCSHDCQRSHVPDFPGGNFVSLVWASDLGFPVSANISLVDCASSGV